MRKSIVNKGGKVIRVGVFSRYYPHYRFGVFRKLTSLKELSFTFYGAKNWPGSFLKTEHDNSDFKFVNIWTKSVRIPFRKNSITLQPYTVYAMLKGNFDVYIMSCDFLDPSVWISLLLARLRRRKVCLWGQGISRPAVPLSWFLRGMMFKLADSILFYSEGVRQQWIDRGMPPEKMFVAYNALDTDLSEAIKTKITGSDLVQFRRDHGLEGKNVIIFCGRLMDNWKRPDILIRAMSKVVIKVPNAHLIIIGDGPDKKALIELADELKLMQTITFLGAIHDEECLAIYFLSSELAVIPAAAGLGIQHAFGYGVPLVVGDSMISHGPEFELVDDGVNGIICRDGDISDFTHAICRLLSNDQERLKMSQNALKVIHEKYNVNSMAKGIYDAVCYAVKKNCNEPSIKMETKNE